MLFSEYVEELRKIYREYDAAWGVARGCTERSLKETEALLGFPLEQGLRDAWRIADGSEPEVRVFSRPGFLTGYDFLPLAAALEQRDVMRRRAPNYKGYVAAEARDRRIRPGWFHDGWLPFAGFAGGTLLLIQDYSPAAAGNVGQIIAFTHDPDEISYVAPDFGRFLRASLSSIQEDPEEFMGIF
jgi:cell wall assembly regulator SMI1